MAWKIFNIGKANAEVDRLAAEVTRLEKELGVAKAAATGADASQLTDALASNETISAQLVQANADLATSKASISSLTANLEKEQGEVNASGGALKAACTALNLEIKAGATSLEIISALQGAVSATLAK